MTYENVTNGTAVGALTSYFWLPSFHSISSACAEIAPVLGALWLLLQITLKLYDRYHGKE
ncbi:hypothetical protein HL667_06245 [Bradyrhizobium sp. 83012]|uniref:Holin n=1 Tax=Bradyrhizobium aeschynomenes TaxID=2734909 RepID=A0ABX2C8K2_9BRAD|nr:hypothetical protein [Bradyrhizobium aeschynomenes]NPU64592.1 hypothetical protein [Bradyrhizobium aeschynomenes]